MHTWASMKRMSYYEIDSTFRSLVIGWKIAGIGAEAHPILAAKAVCFLEVRTDDNSNTSFITFSRGTKMYGGYENTQKLARLSTVPQDCLCHFSLLTNSAPRRGPIQTLRSCNYKMSIKQGSVLNKHHEINGALVFARSSHQGLALIVFNPPFYVYVAIPNTNGCLTFCLEVEVLTARARTVMAVPWDNAFWMARGSWVRGESEANSVDGMDF